MKENKIQPMFETWEHEAVYLIGKVAGIFGVGLAYGSVMYAILIYIIYPLTIKGAI